MNRAQAINGELEPGDWIIVRPENAYGCMVGRVEAIPPPDAADKTGTVHVNFTAFEYTKAEQARLLEAFGHIYPQAEAFDDMPLDDVSIIPGDLISLDTSDFDHVDALIGSYDRAKAFCDSVIAAQSCGDKLTALTERLHANLADYHESLSAFGAGELIGMADKIVAMSDAYAFLTDCHQFDDAELALLLQFQNPLEIVANSWLDYNRGNAYEIGFAFGAMVNHKEKLFADYRLIGDSPGHRESPLLPENPPAAEQKPSIADKLRAGKEKSDANRAQNPASTTKIQEKEIE